MGSSRSGLHLLLISIVAALALSVPIINVEAAVGDDDDASVFFVDSPSSTHRFLRTRHCSSQTPPHSFSPSEVGAAISVLLGFAPPASLSPHTSSKLNHLLSPNPFHRPRAVLALHVEGIHGDEQLLKEHLRDTQVRNLLPDSGSAEIEIPDQDDISVVSLDESLDSECDAACMDNKLQYLAQWLGGSYIPSATEPLAGELIVTLGSGSTVNLHMSKKADKDFVVSIVTLVHNFRKAMEIHEDILRNIQKPAELLNGRFTGIQELLQQYGHDAVAQQGKELFLSALTKLINSVQDTYQGQIVGVLIFKEKPYPESGSMLNVKFSSHHMLRRLDEFVGAANTTSVAEVLLVRRTLAWLTGIILIISTLIGIYFLLNMPLTKDTLLYSNVKLD
ncbi:hypothetical protein Sjap_005884 [Stephania japonica]|uniref:DUF7794 domain-containing protein n=1 Tax=Stephania japonica TaxID=461633 RepID=A0AAP0K4T6_9MAGN